MVKTQRRRLSVLEPTPQKAARSSKWWENPIFFHSKMCVFWHDIVDTKMKWGRNPGKWSYFTKVAGTVSGRKEYLLGLTSSEVTRICLDELGWIGMQVQIINPQTPPEFTSSVRSLVMMLYFTELYVSPVQKQGLCLEKGGENFQDTMPAAWRWRDFKNPSISRPVPRLHVAHLRADAYSKDLILSVCLARSSDCCPGRCP